MRSIVSPLRGFASPFGARAAGGRGFDPSSLFAASEQGAWYDPSDLTSMFQDSAGTIPAAVNSPVGRINDKSGNGNHATQAAAAARPILRQDGDLYYLEFDGVDDRLVAPFPAERELTRTSVLQQIGWTSTDQPFSQRYNFELRQSGVSPRLAVRAPSHETPPDSGLPLGVTGVVHEFSLTAENTVNLQINDGAVGSAEHSPGAIDPQLGIGARTAGTLAANVSIYEVVSRVGQMTTEQLAELKAYYYAKYGITP